MGSHKLSGIVRSGGSHNQARTYNFLLKTDESEYDYRDNRTNNMPYNLKSDVRLSHVLWYLQVEVGEEFRVCCGGITMQLQGFESFAGATHHPTRHTQCILLFDISLV